MSAGAPVFLGNDFDRKIGVVTYYDPATGQLDVDIFDQDFIGVLTYDTAQRVLEAEWKGDVRVITKTELLYVTATVKPPHSFGSTEHKWAAPNPGDRM